MENKDKHIHDGQGGQSYEKREKARTGLKDTKLPLAQPSTFLLLKVALE